MDSGVRLLLVNRLCPFNVVARLVSAPYLSLYNQPTGSTQPFIPPGYVNRVPACHGCMGLRWSAFTVLGGR